MEQGFITGAPDLDQEREHRQGTGGGVGEDTGPVKFEVTDKALDFLGYRALRDLLGSIGRSDSGRHDTHHLSTGVETAAAPKPYEFGDTLNIDPSSTILNAVQPLRRRLRRSGSSDSGDPRHRRRLSGSDGRAERVSELLRHGHHARLQPQHDPLRRRPLHAGQTRGARAAHLIRTQYPGDSLRAVLFHDSAEEIPLKQLGRVRVGPTTRTHAKAFAWPAASSSGRRKTCGRS